MLARLLSSVAIQHTSDKFNIEIIVVDNDRLGSAKDVVQSAAQAHPNVRIIYGIEPIQGISYARNRVVALAKGDYLAFIDDDEYAESRWLASLYETLQRELADAVLGPVIAQYPATPPSWASKSRLFERPRYPTGSRISSGDGRTGNVLIRGIWPRQRLPGPFDVRFSQTGGEDHDFFVWMEHNGAKLIWCDTAVVHEEVPLARLTLRYLLRRRFRAAVVYWRMHQPPIDRWQRIALAMYGSIGGLLLFVLGVLTIPLGLHRSARVWVKGVNVFGRLVSLTSPNFMSFRNQDD